MNYMKHNQRLNKIAISFILTGLETFCSNYDSLVENLNNCTDVESVNKLEMDIDEADEMIQICEYLLYLLEKERLYMEKCND